VTKQSGYNLVSRCSLTLTHEFHDKKELMTMRDRDRLAEEAAASHLTGRSEGIAVGTTHVIHCVCQPSFLG